MVHTLSQTGRLGRIFGLVIAALIAAPHGAGGPVWQQAAVAGGVAAAEVVYRQMVKVGKPGGLLERFVLTFQQLSAEAKAAGAAVPAPPAAPAKPVS